jgi:hypothetical protein
MPQLSQRRAPSPDGSGSLGSREQLLASRELDPRALFAAPTLELVGLDRAPAIDSDYVGPALREQRVDLLSVEFWRTRERTSPKILGEAADRLLSVAIVGAKDPGRAAFYPADGVGRRPGWASRPG